MEKRNTMPCAIEVALLWGVCLLVANRGQAGGLTVQGDLFVTSNFAATNASAFATAAQGALAETAVQPDDDWTNTIAGVSASDIANAFATSLSTTGAVVNGMLRITGGLSVAGNVEVTGCVAEGDGCVASGDFAQAEGAFSTAAGYIAHAQGFSCEASGDGARAESYCTIASGELSIADGFFAVASGDMARAEGCETTASGYFSRADGVGSEAAGVNAHASGFYAMADHDHSYVWSSKWGTPVHSTMAKQYTVYADNGIRLLGGPIEGNGAGLTNFNLSLYAGSNLTWANGKLNVTAVTRESDPAWTATSNQYARVASLGSAAFCPVSTFASAAQGALAETAVQPNDDWTGTIAGVPASAITNAVTTALSTAGGLVNGKLYLAGGALVQPVGDLSMGSFTNGWVVIQ